MRRSTLLVMTALGIPLGVLLFGYALNRKERGDTALSRTAPSEMSGRADRSNDASEQARQSDREKGGVEASTQERPAADGDQSNLELQSTTQGRGHSAPVSNATPKVLAAQSGQAMDLTVAGQPFSVSESVVEACKPAKPGVFRWEACDRANELLIEMAKEGRDEVWAAATEKLLRAYAQQEAGRFTIRALECRQTICFIETASIFGGLPDAGYRFFADHGLKREYSVEAFESDDSGARLTITLFPFIRI